MLAEILLFTAKASAYTALGLVFVGIVCVAFAERGPVDTDLDAKESERPAQLPHLEDRRPTADRLKVDVSDWERASAAEYWEAMKATEDAKRRATK